MNSRSEKPVAKDPTQPDETADAPPKCPKCQTPLQVYTTDWSRSSISLCLSCWFANRHAI
jgi:hypothetical protein